VGDVAVNMPGTIHALGAGVVIYEIQQSSDITYRLYDWDRPASAGRALHLAQSADVSDTEPFAVHISKPLSIGTLSAQRQLLCACRYFAAERLDLQTAMSEDTRGHSPHLLTVLSGSGRVRAGEGEAALTVGQSVVIPAQAGSYMLTPDVGLALIKSYVPDLTVDVITPLRKRGFSDADIAQLGGELRKSDLVGFLTE
jgi:mannose-6-phosphate isomerase